MTLLLLYLPDSPPREVSGLQACTMYRFIPSHMYTLYLPSPSTADSDDEYTQIDPSLPPPLPTSPSHPPPLPTSLPPTTRPPGAQKDPALPPPLPTTLPPTTRPPGASSPKVPRLSSPKPQQKLPRQVSPPSPKPRPPGVNSRRDSSESDKPEG